MNILNCSVSFIKKRVTDIPNKVLWLGREVLWKIGDSYLYIYYILYNSLIRPEKRISCSCSTYRKM